MYYRHQEKCDLIIGIKINLPPKFYYTWLVSLNKGLHQTCY